MATSETIETELTKMLGIKYPIILAGMNGVSHAELAAAVTNAGGLGTIGGLSYVLIFFFYLSILFIISFSLIL